MRKAARTRTALITSVVAVAVFAALFFVGRESAPAPAASALAVAASMKVSYLFSIPASDGALVGPDDQHLTLLLAGTGTYLTRFTDGPLREAFVVANEDFQRRFPEYFHSDLPNAVLTYTPPGGRLPVSVVLKVGQPIWSAAERGWKFPATRIRRRPDNLPDATRKIAPPDIPNPRRFGHATLVIDDSGVPTDSYGNAVNTTTVSFEYTGSPQVWTPPTGVTEISVEAWGAEGSTGSSVNPQGKGGWAENRVSVTPGEKLWVIVGGRGTCSSCSTGAGGGSSGIYTSDYPQSASDVVVVAGGGGGGGEFAAGTDGTDGGLAGNATGGSSDSDLTGYPNIAGGIGGNGGNGHNGSTGGYGGTDLVAGGYQNFNYPDVAQEIIDVHAGLLVEEAVVSADYIDLVTAALDLLISDADFDGGGGGGGYRSGSQGKCDTFAGANVACGGGAGGSSYPTTGSGGSLNTGQWSGNGYVTISYRTPPAVFNEIATGTSGPTVTVDLAKGSYQFTDNWTNTHTYVYITGCDMSLNGSSTTDDIYYVHGPGNTNNISTSQTSSCPVELVEANNDSSDNTGPTDTTTPTYYPPGGGF